MFRQRPFADVTPDSTQNAPYAPEPNERAKISIARTKPYAIKALETKRMTKPITRLAVSGLTPPDASPKLSGVFQLSDSFLRPCFNGKKALLLRFGSGCFQ